jgi:hypothetical protein
MDKKNEGNEPPQIDHPLRLNEMTSDDESLANFKKQISIPKSNIKSFEVAQPVVPIRSKRKEIVKTVFLQS